MTAEVLETTLTITRQLPASPEDVFDAWTTPDILRQWMCPFDTKVVRADLDLRVGGKYFIDMQGEEALHKHEGEYMEIDRPNRLVFTWISAGTHQDTSLVTVTFEKSGDGTALTLVHDRLPDTEAVGDHNRGWTSALDNLQALLAA